MLRVARARPRPESGPQPADVPPHRRFRWYPAAVPILDGNGTPDDCRLDLSDTEAAVLCLSCGSRYAREVTSCSTCGGTHLVPRERLAAAVRRIAPGRSPRDLDRLRLVRVLVVQDPDSLDAIRRGMTEAGFPYLAVSDDGTLLEAGPAGGSVAFFASEDDEPAIRDQVTTWLPAEAGDVEAEPDPPVALPALTDPQPLAVSHGEFEAHLIRAELKEAGIAFACTPGPRGLHFFVPSADLERANELLDGLEGRGPEEQRILEKDLEHLALGGGSSDEAGAEPALPPRTRRSGRVIRRVLLGAMALGCAALALVSPASGALSIVAWIVAALAALALALDVVNPGPE